MIKLLFKECLLSQKKNLRQLYEIQQIHKIKYNKYQSQGAYHDALFSVLCACNQQKKENSIRHLQPRVLFYQGFFVPMTSNCIKLLPGKYWQNLKQQSKFTNKQLHIIIVRIKQYINNSIKKKLDTCIY